MPTPVVRDLFLKFMGLTFVSWLIAGVWVLPTSIVSIWQTSLNVPPTGVPESGARYLPTAMVTATILVPWIIYGLLIWLFLFRTDAVARKLWPKDREVGAAPLSGDNNLTVGVIVLLFGLYLLIPGMAELLAALGIVLEAQDLGTSAFTMHWAQFIHPLSKVIVGAACVRWTHQIESLIVRGWQPKPALARTADDESDNPEAHATS